MSRPASTLLWSFRVSDRPVPKKGRRDPLFWKPEPSRYGYGVDTTSAPGGRAIRPVSPGRRAVTLTTSPDPPDLVRTECFRERESVTDVLSLWPPTLNCNDCSTLKEYYTCGEVKPLKSHLSAPVAVGQWWGGGRAPRETKEGGREDSRVG